MQIHARHWHKACLSYPPCVYSMQRQRPTMQAVLRQSIQEKDKYEDKKEKEGIWREGEGGNAAIGPIPSDTTSIPQSTMPDVEIKPSEAKPAEEKPKIEEKPAPPAPISPVVAIKNNVALIDRGVSTLEPRFTHRVLRTLTALRKRLDDTVLRNAVEAIYAHGAICCCS